MIATLHFLFLFLIVTFNAAASEVTSTKTINSFSEIPNPQEPGTLIVLDIDETILVPTTFHGSKQWYDEYFRRIRTNLNHGDAKAHAIAMRVWNRLQSQIQVRPLDPLAPSWIQKARLANNVVIAETARRPSISRSTLRQMKQLNIEFTPLPFLPQGILFTGEAIEKGGVLKSFVENLSSHNYQVRRIIFVDDSLAHRISVKEAFKESEIKVELYELIESCEGLLNFK